MELSKEFEESLKKKLEDYTLKVRSETIKEMRRHIEFIGNEILEEGMSAKDFFEKLKVLCL